MFRKGQSFSFLVSSLPCPFSLQPDFFASPDLQHDLAAEASLEAFLDEQHPADLDLDPQLDGIASPAVISGWMVVPPLVT